MSHVIYVNLIGTHSKQKTMKSLEAVMILFNNPELAVKFYILFKEVSTLLTFLIYSF